MIFIKNESCKSLKVNK